MADTTSTNDALNAMSNEDFGAALVGKICNDTSLEAVKSDPTAALEAARREMVYNDAPNAPYPNLTQEYGFIGAKTQHVMDAYNQFVKEDGWGPAATRERFYQKLRVYQASRFRKFNNIDFENYQNLPLEFVYARDKWADIPLTYQKSQIKDAFTSLEALGEFTSQMISQRTEAWRSYINELGRSTIGAEINKGNIPMYHISSDLSSNNPEGMVSNILEVFKNFKQDNRYSIAGVQNASVAEDDRPIILTGTKLSAQIQMSLATVYNNNDLTFIPDTIVEDRYFLKYVKDATKRKNIKAIVLSRAALNIYQTNIASFTQNLTHGGSFELDSRQFNTFISKTEPILALTTDEVPLRVVPERAGFLEADDTNGSTAKFVFDDLDAYENALDTYSDVKVELGTVDASGAFTVLPATATTIGDLSITNSSASDTINAGSLDIKNVSNKCDGAVASFNLAVQVTMTSGTGDSAKTVTQLSNSEVYVTLRTEKAQEDFGVL